MERSLIPGTRIAASHVVLAALLIGHAAWFLSWDLTVDDAWISFRYARSLVQGHGLTFNPGEWVEGYSNLAWTLLVAAGMALGGAPDVVATALGLLASLGTVWLTFDVARRAGAPVWAAGVGAALLVGDVSWSFWSAAGLEAPLFGLLALAMVAGAQRETRIGLGAATLAAASLLITRPEGFGLAALLPFGLLLLGRRRAAAAAGGALLAALGTLLAWRLATYGAWMPNPVTAKVAMTPASVGRGATYLLDWAVRDGVWAVLALAFAGVVLRPRETLPCVAVAAAYAVFICLAGGDGLYRFRLGSHVVPVLAVAAAVGLAEVGQRRGVATAAVLALVAGGATLLPHRDAAFTWNASLPQLRRWEAYWTEIGQALGHSLPPDTRIAVNVVGRIPYHSGLPTLDLYGLTDRAVARTPIADAGVGYAGHERTAPAHVLAEAPDLLYFTVLDGGARAVCAPWEDTLSTVASTSIRGYLPMFEDPAFAAMYRPAVLPTGRVLVKAFVKRGGRADHLPPCPPVPAGG